MRIHRYADHFGVQVPELLNPIAECDDLRWANKSAAKYNINSFSEKMLD